MLFLSRLVFLINIHSLKETELTYLRETKTNYKVKIKKMISSTVL